MKKLNLQLGSIKEMLTKEEMKKITGGYGSGGGGGGGGATVTLCRLNDYFGTPWVCDAGYLPTCITECSYLHDYISCECKVVVCHGRGQHACG